MREKILRTGGVIAIVLALAAIAALGVWEWQWDLAPLERWIESHAILGAAGYTGALAASVVLLPFSSLPLLPLAANLYGVWLTILMSTAGWWIGSLVAFQIARFGRRYLERITSMEAIDKLERRVPRDVSFGGIVVLRMIFPVDIVSFALGLTKELSFRLYALASLVGIVPFAAVWSFAGGEIGRGRLLSFAAIVALMGAAVLVIRRRWMAHRH
jgi:uncharacterized membrane protein YdjX (TVP38/TMEM64 family)